MALDADFLAEVEDFLAKTDSPTLSLEHESDIQSKSCSPEFECSKETPQTNATKSTQNAKKTKSYYKLRQMKRENLRRQVKELTAELDKRTKAREARRTQAPSIWRAFAKHQEQERLRAEGKQRRLSAAIDARAAMIHGFWISMQDRLNSLCVATEEEVRLIGGIPGGVRSNQNDKSHVDSAQTETPGCSSAELGIESSQVGQVFCACEIQPQDGVWEDSGQLFKTQMFFLCETTLFTASCCRRDCYRCCQESASSSLGIPVNRLPTTFTRGAYDYGTLIMGR
ncbi:unnamed protein product [Phytophthora lilii]|uniref:Unnamed protein product n=1 Tax=Phytophthora lilii TaxID=2077276 RepID=A0A9W6YK31_9STRA|nr:unnamed protein product [Phytophthora lilii]